MPLPSSRPRARATIVAAALVVSFAASLSTAPSAGAAERPPLLDDVVADFGPSLDCLGGPAPLGLAATGYEGGSGGIPTTGLPYYVDVTWYVNLSCAGSSGGASVMFELGLPDATSLAVGPSSPVRCWRIVDAEPTAWEEFETGCPQQGRPSSAVLPQGGTTLLPVGGGAWQSAPGTGYTLRSRWPPPVPSTARSRRPTAGPASRSGSGWSAEVRTCAPSRTSARASTEHR